MTVKTVAESIFHVLEGLVGSANLQPAQQIDLNDHIAAAKAAVAAGVDTVEVGAVAAAEPVAAAAGGVVVSVANAAIASYTGVFAPELIPLADAFLKAAGDKLEDAIAALFHSKGFTVPAPPVPATGTDTTVG